MSAMRADGPPRSSLADKPDAESVRGHHVRLGCALRADTVKLKPSYGPLSHPRYCQARSGLLRPSRKGLRCAAREHSATIDVVMADDDVANRGNRSSGTLPHCGKAEDADGTADRRLAFTQVVVHQEVRRSTLRETNTDRQTLA